MKRLLPKKIKKKRLNQRLLLR